MSDSKSTKVLLQEAEERAEKYRNDYNEEIETTQRLIWWLIIFVIITVVFGALLFFRGPYVLDVYRPEATCTEGILVQQYDSTWKEVYFQDYQKIVVTKRYYLFYKAPVDFHPDKYRKDDVIFLACRS